MTVFRKVEKKDEEELFYLLRARYHMDPEFRACMNQAAIIAAGFGMAYNENPIKIGVGMALLLQERAPAWNPHPTTQRDKDLRLMSLAALGYLAYRERGETALDLEIDPEELTAALDRLCKVEDT